MRGTPTIYYGDELGLADVAIPPDRVRDPRELREPGLGFGRDPVRTPMPWDASSNAGFSPGLPWLPLNPDWPTRNVAAEAVDRTSMLTLYRDLLRLRRAHPALAIGAVRMLEAMGDVLAYERIHAGERIVVALNLGGRAQPVAWRHGKLLLSTAGGYDGQMLAPDQGVILLAEAA
jgi:alpha-glucosidase